MLGIVCRGLVEQPLGRLPGGARPDVIDQALTHGQLRHSHDAVARELVGRPDAAAQEDPRRAVRARGEHDRPGAELAPAGAHAYRLPILEQHAVDECVRQDREVLALAGRIEYGLPPVGPTGERRPNLWTWSVVMNTHARDRDAAWRFVEWATGAEFLRRFSEALAPRRREPAGARA